MPTATLATDGPQAPAPAPLLTAHDLDDPDQFVTLRRVPVLDAHDDDPIRGVVDVPLLERIARNTNARVVKGDPPALILGHTRAKKYAEEIDQGPLVGHASAFHVAPYQGRPCLHCDFHFRSQDHKYARSFPYRSVERLEEPEDHIDRIALLRTPPQRDLGVLHYSRDEHSAFRRICYARAFPPLGEDDPAAALSPSPPVPEPVSDPAPEESPPMPEMATAPPAAAAADAGNANQPPATVGAMAPDQFMQMMTEAFHAALQMAAEPEPEPDEDHPDAAEYGADDQMVPDEEGGEGEGGDPDERTMYDCATPGAGNAFVPGMAPGDDKEKRRMYEESDRIRRIQYERRFKQLEDENKLMMETLIDSENEKRRIRYERTLTQLESEGYELDRGEELDALTPETPAGYEAAQEQRIRKHYKRTPVRAQMAVGVANFQPQANGNGIAKGRISSDGQLRQAVEYATAHACSLEAAKAALKIA